MYVEKKLLSTKILRHSQASVVRKDIGFQTSALQQTIGVHGDRNYGVRKTQCSTESVNGRPSIHFTKCADERGWQFISSANMTKRNAESVTLYNRGARYVPPLSVLFISFKRSSMLLIRLEQFQKSKIQCNYPMKLI